MSNRKSPNDKKVRSSFTEPEKEFEFEKPNKNKAKKEGSGLKYWIFAFVFVLIPSVFIARSPYFCLNLDKPLKANYIE